MLKDAAANNAGALDRLADFGVFFKQKRLKAQVLEQLAQVAADRPGANNNYLRGFLYHGYYIITQLKA